MFSKLAVNLSYLGDRASNAWWMLRRGKFKLIAKNATLEFNHVVALYRIRKYRHDGADETDVADSAYTRQVKVLPPSYRPTTDRHQDPLNLGEGAGELARQLADIQDTLTIHEPSRSAGKWRLFRS